MRLILLHQIRVLEGTPGSSAVVTGFGTVAEEPAVKSVVSPVTELVNEEVPFFTLITLMVSFFATTFLDGSSKVKAPTAAIAHSSVGTG